MACLSKCLPTLTFITSGRLDSPGPLTPYSRKSSEEHHCGKTNVLIERVFHWVQLAVKPLLDGLRDGDSMEDLQSRLRLVPPDLDRLFQKILGDLDTVYLADASQIFQAVRALRSNQGD